MVAASSRHENGPKHLDGSVRNHHGIQAALGQHGTGGHPRSGFSLLQQLDQVVVHLFHDLVVKVVLREKYRLIAERLSQRQPAILWYVVAA